MKRLRLTGLRADIPLGAMAAFGCLRVCNRHSEFHGSKLAWEDGGGVEHAVLCTAQESSEEALVSALLEDVKSAPGRKEVSWGDQIKTASTGEFRKAAEPVLAEAGATNREPTDWFAAFGSELVLTRDGKIEATPFDMSVARQRFLADAVRLANGLSEDGRGKTARESYEEALFGPWKYEDDQHSLGWDASTMKLGAFTYKAPTAMANAGVRAAVWLAFESLPLFPCFAAHGLQVRSFRRDRREFTLYWPVWQAPIGPETLGSLLGLACLGDESEGAVTELRARGVVALYRSARFKPNKYLASFRPSELVFGGTMAVAG